MSFPDVPDSLTRFAYIFDINCCSRQEQFSSACHGCVWIARIVFLVLDVGVNSYLRICILVHFSYSKLSADWWLEMFATLFSLSYESYVVCWSPVMFLCVVGSDHFWEIWGSIQPRSKRGLVVPSVPCAEQRQHWRLRSTFIWMFAEIGVG